MAERSGRRLLVCVGAALALASLAFSGVVGVQAARTPPRQPNATIIEGVTTCTILPNGQQRCVPGRTWRKGPAFLPLAFAGPTAGLVVPEEAQGEADLSAPAPESLLPTEEPMAPAPAPTAESLAPAEAAESLVPSDQAPILLREDYPLANGWFFTQGNGFDADFTTGFAVLDDPAAPFWTGFLSQGGVAVLGYPVSRRFATADGRLAQAFQHGVLVLGPQGWQVFGHPAEAADPGWAQLFPTPWAEGWPAEAAVPEGPPPLAMAP